MNFSALNRLSPRQRKGSIWIISVLIVYTILGFLVLPPVIRSVAAKQLAAQLHREVSIRQVKLNPYTLSATVRGLLIKDKDGEPFLSWDEVYVNFQFSSLVSRAWVFKEVTITRPFVRVEVKKDYTLNFSDLITQFGTNDSSKPPGKPLGLRIGRLRITGAAASLTDLTPRSPFKRILGPLDVTLDKFRTDSDSRNPYAFSGTTDAGEKFSWSGYFYLSPVRSEGEFSLANLTLNKYAPLYQDFVRFQIRDGTMDAHSSYHFELSPSNRVASLTNGSIALHSFKLAEPGSSANIIVLPEFAVSGASVDTGTRRAEIGSLSVTGAQLELQRNRSNAINVLEISKPAEASGSAPGAIQLLLRSVTNAIALLLNNTNQWSGTLHEVNVQDCGLHLEDLANPRPVRLQVGDITLKAKNISNIPGQNLSADLSARWNTNGTVHLEIQAALTPASADIHLDIANLELRPLDPYLEPKLNIFIVGSKLGVDGHIRLRTTQAELPEVTFSGDTSLNDFSMVDGVLAEDLLKWGSIRVSGMEASLNPPTVRIKEIAINDAYARVVIETNNVMNLMAALGIADTNAPAQAAPKVASTGRKNAVPARTLTGTNATPSIPLDQLSIATVVVSNSRASFSDRSLEPNANIALEQISGTILGLSSKNLRHADVSLHAKVDNVGPVDITGTINPFDPNETNELTISARDIDLTPTSPYSGKFAGYRIAKGKLSMALAYHLRGRSLKAENLITLDQFTFGEKVNSPDATHLPVRLGVAILKDRDGKIVLDVPIEGNMDDPQFRLHKVIVHALVNMFTKIMTSPFAALGSLFGGKGEDIRFQDFAPGSAGLQDAAKEKLDALVKGLYQRPALQLEIQGSVDVEADGAGLRRVFLEKQLRNRKWLSLRKSARAEIGPDQVTVMPEERQYYLKQMYAEALSQGRISTNKTRGVVQTAPMAGIKGRAMEMERGATALLQREDVASVAAAVTPSSSQGRPVSSLEQLVVNSVVVTDGDLEALASERAKAVRAYILQTGQVGPERLFLKESQPGGLKTEGSRAYLQLN